MCILCLFSELSRRLYNWESSLVIIININLSIAVAEYTPDFSLTTIETTSLSTGNQSRSRNRREIQRRFMTLWWTDCESTVIASNSFPSDIASTTERSGKTWTGWVPVILMVGNNYIVVFFSVARRQTQHNAHAHACTCVVCRLYFFLFFFK